MTAKLPGKKVQSISVQLSGDDIDMFDLLKEELGAKTRSEFIRILLQIAADRVKK
jgi:metal-responsive CopG/Arc/MetJ family transcriptional regulator